MNQTTQNPIEIPGHVPPELIIDFNHFTSPGMLPEPGACPYKTLQKLLDGPRVFYAPASGRMLSGNWVVTRNADMRKILGDTDSFSSWAIAGFSHLLGETWDMIPLEVDPPHHMKYRALLNPLFSPPRIKDMSTKIRALAVALIDDIQNKGSCEFIEDFARRFPVRIFMELMGIPVEDYDTILEWENMILHSPDMDVRSKGAHAIRDYLVRLLAERKGKPPVDVLGHIANGEVEGRPMTDTEQLSMSLFLFVAGLDTVASSLGYVFRYLAQHPEAQDWLRADKSKIPGAVEELMRAYGVVITSRKVVKDVEIGGVQMKKGDVVSIPLGLGNYDPEVFPNASEIRLDRTPNPHLSFTLGPHRCLGSHLARAEIAIAIEEWLERMPGLRVLAGTQPVARGGAVFGVDEMHLDWNK